jgi:ATP-dependent DNA helicase RecG
LARPLLGLPGAGPVTARRLAAAGLHTVRDLLLRAPRAYDDLRRVTPVDALGGVADGVTVLVTGTVRRVHVFPRRLLDVTVEQGGQTLRARWFRPMPGMSKGFAKGATVALAGPLHTATDGTRELVHPTNVTAALAARPEGRGLGLRPRYPIVEGVGARVVEKVVEGALAFALQAGLAEPFDAAARARLGVPTLADALATIHAPNEALDGAALEALVSGRAPAHRRLALDELAAVQLAFLLRRAREAGGAGPAPVSEADARAALADARAALSFALTPAQERACAEIARDLAAARPMRRLLVGDVGSGKTAVAFAAAAAVARAGGQTVLMAPTEVLAEQHARTLAPLAERLGFSLALLTAGAPSRARAAALDAVASGRAALLVGTHAVLDDAVTFADLRLVVVDEQHRFGVAQRARARRGAGGDAPSAHLLSLSATPIPRSLALARHGDLDASILDERPRGRRPIETSVCRAPDERAAAYARLRDALASGHQAFVVCHARERARRAGTVTAVARFAELRRELAPARVGLLHGALPSTEKEAVLRAFADGGFDVLVATTVVELGIDVPNAAVMIVEDADRFGVAQLHQLRGRVGRGAAQGRCFLLASDDATSEGDGSARLDAVARNADGFRLAELDLAARGFGDLFGARQTGAPAAGPSDLAEAFALVALARQEAEAIFAADPTLSSPAHAAFAHAARALDARRALFDEGEG